MPGVRPDSIGPVWGVTAWRTSTSVVGFGGAGARASASDGAVLGGVGARRGRCGGHEADGTGHTRRRFRAPAGRRRGYGPAHDGPTDRPAPRRTARDRAPRRPAGRARRARRGRAPTTTSSPAASSCGRSPGSDPRCVTAWALPRRRRSRRHRGLRVLPGRLPPRASTSCASPAGAARATSGPRHPENRGFLAALDGLRRTAATIGETDEADRCAEFLFQLDPNPDGSRDSALPG